LNAATGSYPVFADASVASFKGLDKSFTVAPDVISSSVEPPYTVIANLSSVVIAPTSAISVDLDHVVTSSNCTTIPSSSPAVSATSMNPSAEVCV